MSFIQLDLHIQPVVTERPNQDLVYNESFLTEWQDFIGTPDWFQDLHNAASSISANTGSLCSMRLLSKSQEQYLFRQYNALKWGMNQNRKHHKRWDRYQSNLYDVRMVLHLANVKLCVNFLKKREWLLTEFDSHFSDCMLFLLKCIDKFDYSRNFKFSTYATWAMIRNFIRIAGAEKYDPHTFATEVPDRWFIEERDEVDSLRGKEAMDVIDSLSKCAPERENAVIRMIYGIGMAPMKLEDVGKHFGITKERVRQIKNSGLLRIRKHAKERYPHFAGVD
jgi:RNA polymerase primary sigma factor